MVELAEAMDVSREHLSRVCSSAQIDLLSIADGFLLTEAAWMHGPLGMGWSRVAIRLGYGTQSGLTRLAQRCGQRGLRSLQHQSAVLLTEAWELQLWAILRRTVNRNLAGRYGIAARSSSE